EGEAEYREAVRLMPRYAKAHANLGGALSKRKAFAEAEAELREAVRLQPTNMDFGDTLVRVLQAQSKHGAIAEVAEGLAKASPGQPGPLLSAAGHLSQCIPLAFQDAALSEAARAKLVSAYAAQARRLMNAATALVPSDAAYQKAVADEYCRLAIALQA